MFLKVVGAIIIALVVVELINIYFNNNTPNNGAY